MYPVIKITLTLALTVLCNPCIAASKPDPSQPVSGREIANIFNGNTWQWEDSHGYFGGGGVFEAAWKGRMTAQGKWYATTSGKICVEAAWSPGETGDSFSECWRHVKDADDQLWQSNSKDPQNWNRFDPESELVPGNVAQADFQYAQLPRTYTEARIARGRVLVQLFRGKSWKWNDGYGYFADDGEFRAVSGQETIGQGRWFANRFGRLCYEAVWSSVGGEDKSTRECWTHAVDKKGRVWQTPTDDPYGWYLFVPSRDLVAGEPHAADFTKIQQRLSDQQ